MKASIHGPSDGDETCERRQADREDQADADPGVGGFGLGLLTIQVIAEGRQGSVWMRSITVSVGSAFELLAPWVDRELSG
jgi:signal transduction histidine kinase